MDISEGTRPQARRRLFAIVALTSTVFVVDLLTPRGVAVWLLYLIPLLLTFGSSRRRAPVIHAAIVTGLTAVGFAAARPGVSIELSIVNRSIGVATIWTTALLVERARRAESLVAGQRRVADLIVQGTPLAAVLDALVRFVESHAPGMLASVHLLDEDGIHLRIAAAPSMHPDYVAAVDVVPIGPCVGSCGTAAYRRRGVFVADISTDPLWADYKAAALPHGLRACWSTPILDSRGQVLGTFAMYYRRPRLPRREHLRLIEVATHTAAIAIERLRAEEALREANRKLESTIDKLPGYVYRCANAPNWPVEYISEGVFEACGYRAADFLSGKLSGSTVIAPADRDLVWSEVQKALRDRRPYVLEYRSVIASGEERCVWEKGAGVFDGDRLVALEGFVHDITERKRAEAAVRESERLLLEAQRIAHVGSWSWDFAGPARWTDELYRIYGVSPESYTPAVESFFDLVHPEDRPAMQEWLRACGAGESPGSFEFRAVRPDGTVRFISGRGELVRDAGGRPVRMVGTAHDITAHRQAADALRESEARLRLSVAASNIGLWDWDLLTNAVVFSPEWKSQLGYTDLEIGSDLDEWQSRVHPDDLPPALDRVRRYLQRPEGEHVAEFRMRHKDGSWRWLLTHARAFCDESGRPVRMIGCHIDITVRKRSEEALRELSLQLSRSQEEERRRIGRELHDSTGQKLASLSMAVGMLQDAASAQDAATKRSFDDCLATIDECAREIRTQSYLLHPPLLDELGLPPAIREYADEFAKRSGVRVAVDVPSGLDRFPSHVEIALFRVLQESLGNIHRHSGAETAHVRLVCDAEHVTLEVSDQGKGMAAETLRALEPGRWPTGVGIAGMRERTRLLGGRIEIESDTRGTTVRAVVPLAGVSE